MGPARWYRSGSLDAGISTVADWLNPSVRPTPDPRMPRGALHEDGLFQDSCRCQVPGADWGFRKTAIRKKKSIGLRSVNIDALSRGLARRAVTNRQDGNTKQEPDTVL